MTFYLESPPKYDNLLTFFFATIPVTGTNNHYTIVINFNLHKIKNVEYYNSTRQTVYVKLLKHIGVHKQC